MLFHSNIPLFYYGINAVFVSIRDFFVHSYIKNIKILYSL